MNVCINVYMYERMYVCMYVHISIDKLMTKEIRRNVIQRIATRSKFLERVPPAFNSRNISIYITIYASAISLAIPTCTND